MENEILSLSELAKRMCVSKRRVQQFAQDGLVRRIAHGRSIIPKFYVNESRDEGLNMAGLEAAIQRELEKQKQEKRSSGSWPTISQPKQWTGFKCADWCWENRNNRPPPVS